MLIYQTTPDPNDTYVGWHPYESFRVTLPPVGDDLSQFNRTIWLVEYDLETTDPTAYVLVSIGPSTVGYHNLLNGMDGYTAILSMDYEKPSAWSPTKSHTWDFFPEYYGERTNYNGFKAYIHDVKMAPWRWGDMNDDSHTNNLDIDPFAEVLTGGRIIEDPGLSAIRFAQADFNRDSRVNNLDIEGFLTAFYHGSGSVPVPEPGSLGMSFMGAILTLAWCLSRFFK